MCHITPGRDLQVPCSISAALGASTSLGSAAEKSKFLLVVPPGIFQSMKIFSPCQRGHLQVQLEALHCFEGTDEIFKASLRDPDPTSKCPRGPHRASGRSSAPPEDHILLEQQPKIKDSLGF